MKEWGLPAYSTLMSDRQLSSPSLVLTVSPPCHPVHVDTVRLPNVAFMCSLRLNVSPASWNET